jgi:hypothetical protein
MQITAHSDLPGKEAQAVTVAARKLQDLLRALPDDAVLNIDASGSKMTVRAGRSRFNLQTLPAATIRASGLARNSCNHSRCRSAICADCCVRLNLRWRNRISVIT